MTKPVRLSEVDKRVKALEKHVENMGVHLQANQVLAAHALDMASLPQSAKEGFNKHFLDGLTPFVEIGSMKKEVHEIILRAIEKSELNVSLYLTSLQSSD